jgi:hypothetical protein
MIPLNRAENEIVALYKEFGFSIDPTSSLKATHDLKLRAILNNLIASAADEPGDAADKTTDTLADEIVESLDQCQCLQAGFFEDGKGESIAVIDLAKIACRRKLSKMLTPYERTIGELLPEVEEYATMAGPPVKQRLRGVINRTKKHYGKN